MLPLEKMAVQKSKFENLPEISACSGSIFKVGGGNETLKMAKEIVFSNFHVAFGKILFLKLNFGRCNVSE